MIQNECCERGEKKEIFKITSLISLSSIIFLAQFNVIFVVLLSNGQQQQQPFLAATVDTKIGLPPHNRPACQLTAYNNNVSINQRRSHLSSTNANNNNNLNYFQQFQEELKVPIVVKQADGFNGSAVIANQQQQTPTSLVVVGSPAAAAATTTTTTTTGAMNNNNYFYENNETNKASPTSFYTTQNKSKLDTSERLRQLRQLLVNNNYDAYLVTPNDEHGSEYVADYDRRLKFISGFTGSNGYALILLDKAVLFTDGRYNLQADQDLDCNWWLVVSDEPEMDIHLWLKANYGGSMGAGKAGLKIATDARLMPLQTFDYLDENIKKFNCEFALISQDLIDVVWSNIENGSYNQQEPARLPPKEPLFVHKLQFSGNISWQEKVIKLAESMEKLRGQHYIVSHLDDIAWLLNLRGNDIPMSPLFKSYLFISISQTKQQDPLQAAMLADNNNNNNNNNNRAFSQQATSVEQLLSYQQQSNQLQLPQILHVQPNKLIRITLYVDLKKITKQVREHLHLDNGTMLTYYQQQQHLPNKQQQPITTRIQVDLKDYDVFIMDLRDKLTFVAGSSSPLSPTSSSDNNNNNSQQHQQLEGKLLLDSKANVAIHVLAKTYENRLILIESLINKMKSIKTDGEVNGMRLAHYRDSLAISMLLAQLDFDIGTNKLISKWTEISAANELEFYRSLMDYNRGQSFPSISAYGAQSAIVHYQPRAEERRLIGNESTYLIDSGGQYLDGTTDITRTAHFGEPTNFQCETYTRVLMGSIDMMSLIFEQSERSPFRLNDLLARRHLFELGLNYMHGTGHGIGLYSLVHESPHLIEHYTSSSSQKNSNSNKKRTESGQPAVLSEPVLLQQNMFSSVEPGYYKANDFGIRLENIVVTQRMQLPASLVRPNDRATGSRIPFGKMASGEVGSSHDNNNNGHFLRLEPISLVPFEPKLIKFELLSNKQKAWLNSYNLMVRLRMTQQINYYLNKIKSSQNFGTQTSRLTKLLNSNNSTNSNINSLEQDGYYNYLGMPSEQLREKLEMTHKWIMLKTDLIPLDVPRSLLATNLNSNSIDSRLIKKQQDVKGSNTKAEENGEQQVLISKINKSIKKEEKSFKSDPQQRLMLTYMSSLPFNDLEAGEAVAAMKRQDELTMIGRAGDLEQETEQTNSSNISNRVNSAPNKRANNAAKCAGLECDLWLLQSINSLPSGAGSSSYLFNSKTSNQLPSTWTESFIQEPDERLIPSSLMDLFSLNGSTSQMSSINILWSALLLGTLVIIQLTIMTYMCRSRARGFCSSSSSSSTTSASRAITRRASNTMDGNNIQTNSMNTLNSSNSNSNSNPRRQAQANTNNNRVHNLNAAQAAV